MEGWGEVAAGVGRGMRGGREVEEGSGGLAVLGRAAPGVATGLELAVGEAVGDIGAGAGGRGNVEESATEGTTKGDRGGGEEDETEDEDSGLHPVTSSSAQGKSPRHPIRLVMWFVGISKGGAIAV